MKQPLYRQVMNDIEDKIKTNTYSLGSKLPNEDDLSNYYKVSPITIKRALNELKDLGYVQRKPREGTTVINTSPQNDFEKNSLPLIGAILTDFTDIFGTKILSGILAEEDNTTNVILKKSLGDPVKEEQFIQELIQQEVNGFILLPTTSQYLSPTILKMASNNFPMVVIDRTLEGIPISSITTDNKSSSKLLTSYLINSGHQNIGLITSTNLVTSVEDRIQGYISAHAQFNLPMDKEIKQSIVKSVVPNSNYSVEKDIKEIENFIKSKPQMTAIIATEYNIAILIKRACINLNKKIPDDISIACFDHPDNYFDQDHLKYTHIKQKQYEMGRNSVRLLLDQIKSPNKVNKIQIPGELIIGNTTKKLDYK